MMKGTAHLQSSSGGTCNDAKLIVDWPSPSPTNNSRSGGVLAPKPESDDTILRRASWPHQDQHSDSDVKAQRFLDGFASRRCNLERAKQNSAKSLANTETSHRPARRSSVESGSCSSSTAKDVTFAPKVRVQIIEPKSDNGAQNLWLSKEEFKQIQCQFIAEIKMLKRIAKSSEAAKNDPEIQKVRRSICIRGLEHFCSKRFHRARFACQRDHILAVLEAQDIQRDLGVTPDSSVLAQISAQHSLDARERARRYGMEDEAAAKT